MATCAIWHVNWTSDMMIGIRKAGDKLFYMLIYFYAKKQGREKRTFAGVNAAVKT